MTDETRSCGTGSTGATRPWSNPTYIQADDSNSATNAPNYNNTARLRARAFGFSIPADAVITNLAFTYKIKGSDPSNGGFEDTVELINASSANEGNDVASVNSWYDSWETRSKSGDGAYWGVTLTPDLVNSSNFGIGFICYTTSPTISIQYVSCTVSYEVPGYSCCIARGIGRGIFR